MITIPGADLSDFAGDDLQEKRFSFLWVTV